jgi:hypothetical protein
MFRPTATVAYTAGPAFIGPADLDAVDGIWLDRTGEEAALTFQAEYFVCWNGYTKKHCRRPDEYLESVEETARLDQALAGRHDTLEGRAYGIAREEKKGNTVWKVVFRYTERAGQRRDKSGCAYVAVDSHRDKDGLNAIGLQCGFPLKKVGKIFQPGSLDTQTDQQIQ